VGEEDGLLAATPIAWSVNILQQLYKIIYFILFLPLGSFDTV
jgi:hypothetical protein